MCRLVLVPIIGVLAGCSDPEPACGNLSLELSDRADVFPASTDIECSLKGMGVWSVETDSVWFDLTPLDEVYVSAHMPISLVRPGAVLGMPDVMGEARTYDGPRAPTNEATLTSGTITFGDEHEVGQDARTRVFTVSWDLTWTGQATYNSVGESALVWFNGDEY